MDTSLITVIFYSLLGGVILKEGGNVRNLTTAASIWASGAIGMAIGYEFYFVGMILAIGVALIPRIPHLNSFAPEALHHKPNTTKKTTKK